MSAFTSDDVVKWISAAKNRIADLERRLKESEAACNFNASAVIRIQTDVAELRCERDTLAAKLEKARDALEDAGDTIHGEFCSSNGHHKLHQRVLNALKEIEVLAARPA